MAARRSKEQIILALEEKLKKLKEEASSVKTKELILTKESPGIADVIDAIDKAVSANKSSVVEIIKAIARIRRTGLKIENATRKAKE